ncbi:LPS export ABC transporter permease LptG [Thiohalorhabdus sp.]|uniref:LPS export ABC transporter permease LptG n=1 Tax=Thiohalorhabdus sp. TaxID=3094134 RepID=UPI002FC3DCFB
MTTVDRFLLRGFLAKTGLMLFLLAGIYLLSEALQYSRRLGQEGFDLLLLLQYLALSTPGILAEMAPFGVLLGTLVLLGELARNAELTALRAGGISLARIARPLLLGGAIASALTFAVEDRVAGRLELVGERLLNERVGDGGSGRWLGRGGIWLRDGPHVVSASRVSRTGDNLSGVTIYRLDDQGLVNQVLTGGSLAFRQGVWRLTKGTQVGIAALNGREQSEAEIPLRARPEVIADLGSSPERMGFVKLWGYVDQLRRQGQPTDYLAFTLWQKVTLPLACVVMVLVAAPFVSLTPRSENRVARLLGGIGLGMLFHASNVLVEQLSVAGGLPPGVAAWLPLVVFTALGGLMLARWG